MTPILKKKKSAKRLMSLSILQMSCALIFVVSCKVQTSLLVFCLSADLHVFSMLMISLFLPFLLSSGLPFPSPLSLFLFQAFVCVLLRDFFLFSGVLPLFRVAFVVFLPVEFIFSFCFRSCLLDIEERCCRNLFLFCLFFIIFSLFILSLFCQL